MSFNTGVTVYNYSMCAFIRDVLHYKQAIKYVYYDLNVCYYRRPMLNIKETKCNLLKLRLLQFIKMCLIKKINAS